MKKRGLTVIVLVILGVIIGVILFDFLNNRPDRLGSNPYALEVDQYREVDEKLISHEETRNFSLGPLAPAGIDYLLLRTDKPFVTALRRFLNRRDSLWRNSPLRPVWK